MSEVVLSTTGDEPNADGNDFGSKIIRQVGTQVQPAKHGWRWLGHRRSQVVNYRDCNLSHNEIERCCSHFLFWFVK